MKKIFIILLAFLSNGGNTTETGDNLKLQKCAANNLQNVNSVQLPISPVISSEVPEIYLKTQSLIPASSSQSCRSEVIKLTTKFALSNVSSTNVWRHANLLLESGYLSVSNLSDESISYFAIDEYCIADIHGEGDNTSADLKICTSSSSPERPVLNKCCPLGLILSESGCVKENEKWDPIYMDSQNMEEFTPQKTNPIYHCPKLGCNESESWLEDGCHTKFYPVSVGKTAFIGRHRTWEILEHPPDSVYCYERHKGRNGLVTNILIMCHGNETKLESNYGKGSESLSYLYAVCMYVGAFFNFLTSFVYLITWLKQSIYGRTLCSCTLALFFMQIFLGTAHLLGITGITEQSSYCYFNGVAAQYFFLAAFTWLLLLNINLWWSFRSPMGIEGDSSKWEQRRFLIYSLAGWGFPFLVTGISILLNSVYKCRTSGVPIPEYGVHTCFIAAWALGYYLYYILAVLMGITLMFATMTLAALFNYTKATSNVGANKRAENKRTVLLFLKLSAVMGLSWAFEIVSWALTKEEGGAHWIWTVFDIYNILSAILIFIIFVCQRNTLNLLQEVHPAFDALTERMDGFTPTFRRKEYSSVDDTRVD